MYLYMQLSPTLIRSPYLMPENCGALERSGLLQEPEVNAFTVAVAKHCGHIKEGGRGGE